VDDAGKIVREVKVASEPEDLLQILSNPGYHFKRIGLEAGPLSQWLFSALAEAGLPVICVETRHMRAVLKAQINKTGQTQARLECPFGADCVAKVESCSATNSSRKHEPGSHRRFG
jgi:transposase